jgi:hypothetical protein
MRVHTRIATGRRIAAVMPVACVLALPARVRADTGVEFGAVLGDQAGATAFGLRSGPTLGGHPGPEIAVAVIPGENLLFMGDLDLVLPFGGAGRPVFIGRGGISAIGGAYAGGVLGYNFGAGVIQPLTRSVGLRGDVVFHFYPTNGNSYLLTSFTAGIVWGR